MERGGRLHFLGRELWSAADAAAMRRRGRRRSTWFVATLLFFATTAHARVLMTQQQALASAFPAGTKVDRQTIFLSKEQVAEARKKAGVDFDDQLVVRYVGTTGSAIAGYAYFDTHRVRTLPETVMVVVTADGRVDRVDVLSFDEPPQYLPKRRWLDQLLRRKLDDDLSLTRAIRPMSGASLTARSLVNASRKVLALHTVIGQRK